MTHPFFRGLWLLASVAAIGISYPSPAPAQFLSRDKQADVAGLTVRINTLEDQIRQLNGQVEQLSFQVRRLQQALSSGALGQQGQPMGQPLGQGGAATGGLQPQTGQQQWGQPQGNVVSGAPQTLGQITGQPLDLSSALGQPVIQPSGQPPLLGTPVQTLDNQQNPQLVLAPSDNPKDAYDLSYGYILRGEYGMADASFRQFLSQFPNDPLAGNAQYWIGESLFARHMYRDAADAFLKGASDYPDGAKAPDSLYKLGMSLKELGQADAACSSFAEITRRYPNAPQAVQERARSEMQKSGC